MAYHAHQCTYTHYTIGNIYLNARLDFIQSGIFASCRKNNFKKFSQIFGIFQKPLLRDYERGNHHPPLRMRKGVRNMDEPTRSQWQIRCAFNGFCKRTLKHGAINVHKQTRKQQLREVTFSDLAPHDEKQLYTLDTYFESEAAEAFTVSKIKKSCSPTLQRKKDIPTWLPFPMTEYPV